MQEATDLTSRKSTVLKAVAHPVRLRIVEELSLGERCVCEIADLFPYDRTTVSKHLAILRHCGVIEDRKRGQHVYYALRMECLVPFLHCLGQVLQGEATGAATCEGSCSTAPPVGSP